jgi:hypothetical protein
MSIMNNEALSCKTLGAVRSLHAANKHELSDMNWNNHKNVKYRPTRMCTFATSYLHCMHDTYRALIVTSVQELIDMFRSHFISPCSLSKFLQLSWYYYKIFWKLIRPAYQCRVAKEYSNDDAHLTISIEAPSKRIRSCVYIICLLIIYCACVGGGGGGCWRGKKELSFHWLIFKCSHSNT